MKSATSVQDASVDVVWIRDGVVALGHRPADRCYRAILAVEGPPEAFAAEVERVQPLIDGFGGFLNALGQASVPPPSALQILVRAERADLSEYATRLEQRAQVLPQRLRPEVLADAAWARQHGPGLGLLRRSCYLVVPAEALPAADLPGRLGSARSRLGGWFNVKPRLSEADARQALNTRCAELLERLKHSGVWAWRLDDIALVRLFQACWSARRNSRFERDLQACAPAARETGSPCRY
jgi:hypothetical protein